MHSIQHMCYCWIDVQRLQGSTTSLVITVHTSVVKGMAVCAGAKPRRSPCAAQAIRGAPPQEQPGTLCICTGKGTPTSAADMPASHHVRYKSRELTRAARQPLALYQVCDESIMSLRYCLMSFTFIFHD